jgi:hypothetical protein
VVVGGVPRKQRRINRDSLPHGLHGCPYGPLPPSSTSSLRNLTHSTSHRVIFSKNTARTPLGLEDSDAILCILVSAGCTPCHGPATDPPYISLGSLPWSWPSTSSTSPQCDINLVTFLPCAVVPLRNLQFYHHLTALCYTHTIPHTRT